MKTLVSAKAGYGIMDENRASEVLADAALEPPEGHVAKFRLWHFPREGAWTTWVLFAESSPGAGVVREDSWSRDVSFGRREAAMPEESVRRILSRAAQLGIENFDVGTGSPASEFGIQGYATRSEDLRVAWDPPVPREFRPIAAWFSRTRAAFESYLDSAR